MTGQAKDKAKEENKDKNKDVPKLPVSETFYSIQGEGATMGVPAVFLRLRGCNLTCGGQDTVKTKGLDSGATWRCDTIEVWTKGKQQDFTEIREQWSKKGFLDHFRQGAHLIITGGEPLLYHDDVLAFIRFLRADFPDLVVEIETNGTFCPSSALREVVSQFNVSPKLANSGMSKEKRLDAESLACFSKLETAIFKCVVSQPSDIIELQNDIIAPYNVDPKKIYVMPAASTREELESESVWVVKEALRFGYRYSSRLQLLIWDKTVGV